MSKDLYGLIDPSANKFIVVSKSFTSIKKVQFVIMQKYFYPVANITKTIQYQTAHNSGMRDAVLPQITNENCTNFGMNETTVKSLEQTLSFANCKEVSINESPTDIQVDNKLKKIIETMLQIFEITEIQTDAMIRFIRETTVDRHNGIMEFKKFLNVFLETKEQHKGLNDIFDQEEKLLRHDIPEITKYKNLITKTIVDIFYELSLDNDDSITTFVSRLINILKTKVKNDQRVVFPNFLMSDGFDEIKLFRDNENIFKNFSSRNDLAEQLIFYLEQKHNDIL